MKKRVLISGLASLFILQNLAANETNEVKETKIEDVYVTTATKTQKNIDGVSASVVVITAEDIERTSATTVGDVLRKVPSINVQVGRFPHPSSASKGSVSIRGVGPNGTLILVDGQRLSGETESPYELNRIPVSMIERIEIIKGSMSTLYGSDAIGGVINIITKKGVDTNHTTIDMKYGANNYSHARNRNANFSTLGNINGFKYKAFASVIDTSSYKVNEKYSQKAMNPSNQQPIPSHPQHGKNGVLGVTYGDDSTVTNVGAGLEKDITDSFTLGANFNYFEEDREGQYLGSSQATGFPGMVMQTPVKSRDDNNRKDMSVIAKYYINDDLSTTLKYYRSDYKKRNKTSPTTFDGPVSKKFSANVTIDDVESTTTYALNSANLFTLGLNYRKEKRDSSAINPNPQSSDFIRKNVEYKSIYLQDEITITDSLNATLGARYDDVSNADSEATFQVGLVQKLGENTRVRANYASGYRAPDMAELYVNAPIYKNMKPRYGALNVGYDLDPEKSDTFELAIANSFNNFNSELVLFKTIVKDKIETVSKANYYTFENLDKAEINGIEVNLDYKFGDSFDTSFSLTYLDTEDKETNKDLLYTANLSAALNMNYKILNNLSSNLAIRYVGKQDAIDTAEKRYKLDDYTLVDFGLNYDINKTFTLYGGVDNIFDKSVDLNADINVGTYYFAGLKAKF